MKKAKSGKERKKHVTLKIFFAIWIIASTLFFIKMGSSLMIEATYKDNYHYAVLNSPHNIKYQKKIYGIYKKHVEYLSDSNDEIISSYFSLDENYRIIILFIAVSAICELPLFIYKLNSSLNFSGYTISILYSESSNPPKKR